MVTTDCTKVLLCGEVNKTITLTWKEIRFYVLTSADISQDYAFVISMVMMSRHCTVIWSVIGGPYSGSYSSSTPAGVSSAQSPIRMSRSPAQARPEFWLLHR